MKQSSTGGRVITFRKVVINPSTANTSNGSNDINTIVSNGRTTSGAPILCNGMVANGINTQPSIGGGNGMIFTTTNGVLGGNLAASTNGVLSNGLIMSSSTNGATTNTNTTILSAQQHQQLINSGTTQTLIRPQTLQNGRVIVSSANIINSTAATSLPQTGRICLTQQQLQKLLEQQLQQQQQQHNVTSVASVTGGIQQQQQPQIIRLHNPQQLIRLQQPQQVVRLQAPAPQQQIIRIPSAQLSQLQQGHQQLSDGRIIIPQPIQITAQQLQQLQQLQQQQRQQQQQQQPIAIQPLHQSQPQLLPGVQVVSIAGAHNSLLGKQQQHAIFPLSNPQQVISTNQQPQQVISTNQQPQQILSTNQQQGQHQIISPSQPKQQVITSQQLLQQQQLIKPNQFVVGGITPTGPAQQVNIINQQQPKLPIINQILTSQAHTLINRNILSNSNSSSNNSNNGITSITTFNNNSSYSSSNTVNSSLTTSVGIADLGLPTIPKIEPQQQQQPIDDVMTIDDDDDIKEIGQVVHHNEGVSNGVSNWCIVWRDFNLSIEVL